MPVITNAACKPPVIKLEQPFDVDISIRTNTPGPVSFHFTIADDLPYFILGSTEPAKSLVCKRSFSAAEEYTSRFVLQIGRASLSAVAPTLRVTVSGLDGTSVPFLLGLNVV